MLAHRAALYAYGMMENEALPCPAETLGRGVAWQKEEWGMIGDLFQPTHLIIVLVIVLIVFGPGKLPDIGAAFGKGIKEFKKGANGEDIATATSAAAPAPAIAQPAVIPAAASVAVAAASANSNACGKCGTVNEASHRFCAGCGTPLAAPVPA